MVASRGLNSARGPRDSSFAGGWASGRLALGLARAICVVPFVEGSSQKLRSSPTAIGPFFATLLSYPFFGSASGGFELFSISFSSLLSLLSHLLLPLQLIRWSLSPYPCLVAAALLHALGRHLGPGLGRRAAAHGHPALGAARPFLRLHAVMLQLGRHPLLNSRKAPKNSIWETAGSSNITKPGTPDLLPLSGTQLWKMWC